MPPIFETQVRRKPEPAPCIYICLPRMILHRQKRSSSFHGPEEEKSTISTPSVQQQYVSRRRHSWPSRNGLGIPYHPSELLSTYPNSDLDDNSAEPSSSSVTKIQISFLIVSKLCWKEHPEIRAAGSSTSFTSPIITGNI
jgi:hypothetical protein